MEGIPRCRLKPISPEDGGQVMAIYNYYVENSFAAFPERKVSSQFFDLFMNLSQGYPFLTAKSEEGNVLGFGLLHAYNPMSTFSRAAEITYFISPEETRLGIGQMILDRLIEDAKKLGITSILACISSENQPSLAFHRKNGFRECGRFINIGRKMGMDFDVVWMQKLI